MKTWWNLKCKSLCERNQSEKAPIHTIPTICYPGKGKTMERQQKEQWLTGVRGKGGMNRWNRGFLEQWSYSVWYHNVIKHLPKVKQSTPPRVTPNVNCRPWMIMWQRRFTDLTNKCPALVQEVDNGEAVCWGDKGYMRTLLFSLSFVVNLK